MSESLWIATAPATPRTRLQQAARYSLEKADAETLGNFYGFMSSIVFSAFALEACANHLGAKRFAHWTKLDRKPTEDKLAVR